MTSLFRTRQPFLQTNAWQNQALNALHYNTSQQGSVVPLVYGTTRQQVNVIDLLNYMGPTGKKGKTGSIPLTGTANTVGKGGGGSKGKGSKKNVNFSVDVMFAVCQGPVAGVPLTVYSSSGVASFGGIGLNFYTGDDGQAVDSVFNGLGHSVNYSGTAVMSGTPLDLGQSPVLPNLSVEQPAILVGADTGGYNLDANPGHIINDFLTNPRYGAEFPLANFTNLFVTNGYGPYCQAAQLLISVSLDGHQKAIEYLDQITKLTNSTLVWSGKVLKIIPWGDLSLSSNGASWIPNLVPVYSFTDDDFIPWQAYQEGSGPKPGEEDPILVTRANPADAYNWFSIEYTDRTNFYNSTTLTVSDQGAIDQYGLRIGDTIQGRAFCNQISAQISAQLTLQRSQYVRNTPYRFQVGWRYGLLEPMDIVLLTGRMGDIYLNQQPVRVTSVEEDENGNLTVEAEEIQVGASAPPPAPITLYLTNVYQTGYGAIYPYPSGFSTTVDATGKVHNTIILLVISSISNGAAAPETVSSISDDTGGLITGWNQRWAFSHTVPNSGSPLQSIDMELWWADARGLTDGQTINVTVNFSGSAHLPAVSMMDVTGSINYSTVFDSNPSVPDKITDTLTTPSATGISTSAPSAILMAFLATVSDGAGGNLNSTLATSMVTVGGNSPLWSRTLYGYAYGIRPGGGTNPYYNSVGFGTQLPLSGQAQFNSATVVPFAQQPGNHTNINPGGGGYMLVVDAIAGT